MYPAQFVQYVDNNQFSEEFENGGDKIKMADL